METERNISRVDDRDIVEPHIWQLNKVYQTEEARIDRYLRQRALAKLSSQPNLSVEDLTTTADDEQDRLKAKFCQLDDDQGLDPETYENARSGEIRRRAPKKSTIMVFHIFALIMSTCELSLFFLQAKLLEEYKYVPIIFGILIVIFSWGCGYHVGQAMFKWFSFRGDSLGLGPIGESRYHTISANRNFLAFLVPAIIAIALVRSYGSQTFNLMVFTFTTVIAIGIIIMEAWAIYEKNLYESAVSLMVKAQRVFATKNHLNMYNNDSWQKNFLAHYQEQFNRMQRHDDTPSLYEENRT
ncbi:MAG: hypothetical protein AB7R40_26405 [Nitrospiraceae bacterium]